MPAASPLFRPKALLLYERMFVSPAVRHADEPAAFVTDLPLERLEHEIVQLSAHINAGMCRWLELVAEFDRREGWGSWNCRSCAEWVAWRCALDSRSAREHVRVARRLAEVPRIHAAFARGELSYSKVRALTRVADGDCEEELMELAHHATASQLERIVRGLRRMNTEDAREALENRYFSTWWEADGSLSISGNLPAEEGAALVAALDAMHDLIRARAGSAEPRADGPGDAEVRGSAEPQEPVAATHADALVAMADAAVSGDSGRMTGGDRHQVIVRIDVATLAGEDGSRVDAGSRVCRTADGSAIAPETARRLACDCSLIPVVTGADGDVLDVGRKKRKVPPSLRRAVEVRDETCTFPGCEHRRFIEDHHIRHWAHGGETTKENITQLCHWHHRLLHEGGYSVERLPDERLVFRDQHGIRVAAPVLPQGQARQLEMLAGDRRANATLHPGTGEKLDLDLTLVTLGQRVTSSSSASS